MADDPRCPCRSGIDYRECHAPGHCFAFVPAGDAPVAVAVPGHIGDALADELATMFNNEGPWKVSREGRRWLFVQNGPLHLLTAVPLLRDRPKDGTPDSYVVGKAFQGLAPWPTGDSPTPEAYTQAEQALISSCVTWDTDRLYKIRESVAILFDRPTADALHANQGEIATAIKTALPMATLDLVRFNKRALTAAPLIRYLVNIQHVHPDVLKAAFEREQSTYGAPFYHFDPAAHYELLANINFPITYAFGIRMGLAGYLVLDYGQEITLPPQEAVERRARDIGARLLMTERSDAISSKRFPDLRAEQRHHLRGWIAARLNALYAHLCALQAAPVGADGCVDPADLLKDLLALEDILALTQMIATSSDPALRRLLFFDLMDRYAELGGKKRIVSELLNDEHMETIATRLCPELGPLQPRVADYIRDAWGRVSQGLWDGVLDEQARTSGSLNIAPPSETPRLLSKAELVPELMYALRNTTHGYHLHKGRFESLLTKHTGLLPDAVRELAIGLWFGLLSSPSIFWGDEARFRHVVRVGELTAGPS